MGRKCFFICHLFFIIIITSCQSNNRSDLIFEFEDGLLENEGWNVVINSTMKIDKAEKVNGKYPLKIGQVEDTIPSYKMPVLALFYREVLLANQKNSDTATLHITNRSLNLEKAIVKIFCINEKDDIVFCDSININNKNSWSTSSFSFSLNETRKIVLGIYVVGCGYPFSNVTKPQGLWLDKIVLQSSGEWLNDANQQFMKEQIETNYLTEINIPFDAGFHRMAIPDDKMIIGIGEAVHGSRTINQMELGLAKKMILHDSCKLVLFELDMFQLMIWNQYVQGKLPADYINEIKKALLSTLISSEEVGDFLVWLREYNNTIKEKVNIQGILPLKYGYGNQLFHYLYMFYAPSTATIIDPLLRKLGLLQDLPDALNYAEEMDSSLKMIIGDREYAMFLYALKKAVNNNMRSESLTSSLNLLLYKEILMAENVNHFISLYLQDGKKACIIAHNAHVNKKLSSFTFPHLYSMGYYLHQKYGDKYYALGIFPGRGNIFVGTDNYWAEVSGLGPLLPNSLEDVCMQTGLTSFFYPANYLKNDFLYYRVIGNQHIGNEYECGNIKTQMDGIIFVNEIDPIHTKTYDIKKVDVVPEMAVKEVEILMGIIRKEKEAISPKN